jgi:ABC transporter DrrB family efflux protein
MTAVRLALSDAVVLAERSLRRIPRQPDLLTAFTIQPIMFVLLFVYVFGGAIEVPEEFGDYTDFLMPGIMVQTIAFGGFVTALGIAEDLNKGLIDRFRSLPMARSAVLTGRTIADIATNTLSLVTMIVVGLIVGFSFSSSVLEVIAGIALILLIGYTFSWIFAWVGLNSGSPETANALGFMLIFPLTFLSSAFVPPESMPKSLEFFAEDINPFTTMVDAMRALFIGTPAGNDIWGSVLWCVGLIALFSFLSARSYRNAISK